MACIFCDGTLVAFETPIFSYTMVTDFRMGLKFVVYISSYDDYFWLQLSLVTHFQPANENAM